LGKNEHIYCAFFIFPCKLIEQVGSSNNAFDLHIEGSWFESQPGQ
jgi:hypothetical protein